jgi:hypothetical protein
VLPWVALAFGLYLAAFVITMAVHEPLNGVLRAAGDPDRGANRAVVRDAFQETRWVTWHIVRTIATTAAFGCLAWALVLHGRATPDATDHETPRAGTSVDRGHGDLRRPALRRCEPPITPLVVRRERGGWIWVLGGSAVNTARQHWSNSDS